MFLICFYMSQIMIVSTCKPGPYCTAYPVLFMFSHIILLMPFIHIMCHRFKWFSDYYNDSIGLSYSFSYEYRWAAFRYLDSSLAFMTLPNGINIAEGTRIAGSYHAWIVAKTWMRGRNEAWSVTYQDSVNWQRLPLGIGSCIIWNIDTQIQVNMLI